MISARSQLWMMVLALLAGCATASQKSSAYLEPEGLEKGRIVHLETGVALTRPELMEWLADLPVTYVGETHDSLDDHQVELEVLEALADRHPSGLALGLEMLRRPDQAALDDWLAGRSTDEAFRQVWADSWGAKSWPYYEPLLRLARERGIPVLALNAGQDLVRAVARGGLEAAPEGRLPEMDLADPYHRALVEAVFAGHAAGHGDPERFVQIQTLWDETMAETAARWLKAHPDGHLMVVAGTYHVAWGVGIPRRVFRRVPRPYAILVPVNVEDTPAARAGRMDVELPELPLPFADVVWAVGYETLEDTAVPVPEG